MKNKWNNNSCFDQTYGDVWLLLNFITEWNISEKIWLRKEITYNINNKIIKLYNFKLFLDKKV